MFRSGVAILAVAFVGLFGFYYMRDSGEQSRADRAKNAARQVGDAVRDKGVSELVEARLVTTLGLDATRFLHAHYDDGRVVIYGLLPPAIAPQAVSDAAAKVPGVRQVELFVQARPDYLGGSLLSGDQEPTDRPAPTGDSEETPPDEDAGA